MADVYITTCVNSLMQLYIHPLSTPTDASIKCVVLVTLAGQFHRAFVMHWFPICLYA